MLRDARMVGSVKLHCGAHPCLQCRVRTGFDGRAYAATAKTPEIDTANWVSELICCLAVRQNLGRQGWAATCGPSRTSNKLADAALRLPQSRHSYLLEASVGSSGAAT